MQRRINKNQRGFTLVELLATIVILGVLLLIAVPSISELINRSKQEVLLTDAKMYLNAAKLEIASSGYEKDTKIIKIEDIETEKGNSNYSGRIMAIKNKTTGEYKYSIFMVDNNTYQSIGKLKGVIPVFAEEITRKNISKVDEVAYKRYQQILNTGTVQESFIIEGEKVDSKKTITESGELFDLLGAKTLYSWGSVSYTQVYLNVEIDGKEQLLTFYVINDTGNKMRLLLKPTGSQINDSVMKYADTDSNTVGSDIEDYMYKYLRIINVAIEKANGIKENISNDVKLLTVTDLYQFFEGTDSSFDGISSLLKENAVTLKTMFPISGTNVFGSKSYKPNLIIYENNDSKDEYVNDACNARGEITSKSDIEGTVCYGLHTVDSQFAKDADLITPHNGEFYVRLVFEIPGSLRSNFFTLAGDPQNSRLENFYD